MQQGYSMKNIILLVTNSVLLLWLSLSAVANADEDADEDETKSSYKLTVSDYSTHELRAKDLNIRGTFDDQELWLGYYKNDVSGFEQTRLGYERNDEFRLLKLKTTLQAATHSFAGLSCVGQIGGDLYAIAGIARTNLHPFENINFDPNDAITYGAGYEFSKDNDVALYRVRDDRVTKGQQIDHLLIHRVLASKDKATVDIFNKSGTPDSEGKSIAATGAAITYERPRYFMRVSYDPKVNFSQTYMTRIALGIFF